MQTFDRLKEELWSYAKNRVCRESNVSRFDLDWHLSASCLLHQLKCFTPLTFLQQILEAFRGRSQPKARTQWSSQTAKSHHCGPDKNWFGSFKTEMWCLAKPFRLQFSCMWDNDNKLKFHDLLTNFSISDPVPAIFPPWFWRNVALRSPAAKPHSGALPRTSPVHQDRSRNTKRWSKVENTSSI